MSDGALSPVTLPRKSRRSLWAVLFWCKAVLGLHPCCLGLSWIVLVMAVLCPDAWSQTPFDQVASDIKAEYQKARKDHRQTIQEIQSRRKALQQKLADLDSRLATAAGSLTADRKRLEDLSQERDKMTQEVSRRLTDNKELGGLFRDHARNFLALAERSPYTAERPERLEKLRSFVDPHRVFRLNDLKALLDLSFEDMTASRERVAYKGEVVDRNGGESKADIVRLGHLPAIYGTEDRVGYLSLGPASGRLIMSPSPSYWVRRNLRRYLEGKTEDVYTDVSGGAAIQQLSQRITLMEQLKSGGVLVIPILFVGLVVLVLTMERLLFLGKVRQNTDELMTRVTELVEKNDIDGAVKAAEPHRQPSHRPGSYGGIAAPK